MTVWAGEGLHWVITFNQKKVARHYAFHGEILNIYIKNRDSGGRLSIRRRSRLRQQSQIIYRFSASCHRKKKAQARTVVAVATFLWRDALSHPPGGGLAPRIYISDDGPAEITICSVAQPVGHHFWIRMCVCVHVCVCMCHAVLSSPLTVLH